KGSRAAGVGDEDDSKKGLWEKAELIRSPLAGSAFFFLGRRLVGAVGLDVIAKGDVEVQGLLNPAIQHAQPVGGRLLQLSGAQQVACLHNDLEGVTEIVGELAHLDGYVFGNLSSLVVILRRMRGRPGALIGHEYESYFRVS